MYQKYTTEGFLVSSRGSGEADRLFFFYTEEFGMIMAHATSVRLSKSKLRPHISPGVKLSLTFLKSKARWKLLEARAEGEKISQKEGGYKIFLKLLTILKSLVQGEEKNESLWQSTIALFEFLRVKNTDETLAAAECLAMIQTLHALGYGEPKGTMEYETAPFNDVTLKSIAKEKTELIKGINKALQATGL